MSARASGGSSQQATGKFSSWPRAPRAAAVALYALGLCAGFLLAALASAPGGAWVVSVQLQLALVAGAVGALALMRARAVARRRAAQRALRTPL